MFELILASASPRRLALLQDLGFKVSSKPQDIDETPLQDEDPEDLVTRLALTKARSALDSLESRDQRLVLGSDTIVLCDGQILGKPVNKATAYAMLRLLSGRQHHVITAVALLDYQREAVELSKTAVSFRTLRDDEIESYWETGEPADKAGAYAIQGLGGMFISEINGSYSGVVGLPIFETASLLAQFHVDTSSILKSCHE
jgi:septum formation protein